MVAKKLIPKACRFGPIEGQITSASNSSGIYFENFIIQWDLNFELVRYLNGWKEVGCQMVLYLNSIWKSDSQTSWIPYKWTQSFSYLLVLYSNSQSCTTGITHKLTIWIPNPLKSELQKVGYSNGWYSDPHCTLINYKPCKNTLTKSRGIYRFGLGWKLVVQHLPS